MPNEQRPLNVLLCFAAQDEPAVLQLSMRLQKEGINSWLGLEESAPNENSVSSLYFDSVLVCLSRHSFDNEGNVKKEIELTFDEVDHQPGGPAFLLVVRLEECQIPDRLRNFQSVNFFEPDGDERLLEILRVRSQELEISSSQKKRFLPFLLDVMKIFRFRTAESSTTVDVLANGTSFAFKDLWKRNRRWIVTTVEVVGGVSSFIAVMVFLTGKENISQFFQADPTLTPSQVAVSVERMEAAVTLTPTILPSQEPTSTVTLAPTPETAMLTATSAFAVKTGYTIVDKDEVFSLSPTVKALGELAKERYTPEERNQVDRKLVFTINATPDVPMFWRWYWCAATENILEQNLEEMDVIFEADGRVIPHEQLATVTYSYKNQDGDTWWCFTYSTVLRDWEPGTYRFIQTTVIKSAIHDGKDIFPAGLKIYDYTVTISPD